MALYGTISILYFRPPILDSIDNFRCFKEVKYYTDRPEYTVEEIIIWAFTDFASLPTDKELTGTVLLMVGLFQQLETESQFFFSRKSD